MRGLSNALGGIFNAVYVGIVVNVCLALTCAPVWVLATLIPLQESWPWVVLSGILMAPALAGVYAVFRAYSLDGSVAPFRTYFLTWAQSWPRVFLPGLGMTALFLVIGLDFVVMAGWGLGLVALPVAVMLVALCLATACVAWVGLAARPDLTRWGVVRGSLYLAVRSPGWSLVALTALAVGAGAVWVQPLIGVGLAASPVLYVVWLSSRRIFSRYLPASETAQVGAE